MGSNYNVRKWSEVYAPNPAMLRQILVLLPALPQFPAFLWRQFPKPAIPLARLVALLRRQLRPLTHTFLQPLLPFRRHIRVTLRYFQPTLPSFRFDLIPFLRQRPQHVPLLSAQLRPRWCRLSVPGHRQGQHEQQPCSYCCSSCEVFRSHASNPGSV